MTSLEFGAADIPPGFDLRKYEQCAGWGLAEWWRALAYRRPFHEWATLSPEEMAQDEDNPDLLETLRGNALAFIKNPLPIEDEEFRVYPARSSKPAIRDLTGADYYDGLFKLDKWDYERVSQIARKACQRAEVMDFEKIESEVDGLKAFIELDRMPAWTIHREANAAQDSYCIEVDLGASDKHLVDEFKAWLKQIRKDAGVPQIPKQYGSDNFADWHEKRLLPYLDLTLWARLHGGGINLSALGDALFPDEALRGSKMRDVEPMIRRTTGPRARAMISLEVIATLTRQLNGAA